MYRLQWSCIREVSLFQRVSSMEKILERRPCIFLPVLLCCSYRSCLPHEKECIEVGNKCLCEGKLQEEEC